MAWATGTAAGHNDLLNKLVAFLSTNEELVAAGQQWEVLRNSDWPYTAPAPSRIAFSTNPTSTPAIAPDAWPNLVPRLGVKMKITGKLIVPTAGTYTFSLRADDQAEVRIDGVLRFSTYTATMSNNSFVNSGSIALTAGEHDIDVRMVNITDSTYYDGVSLGWQKPGDAAFSIIPAANFSGLTLVHGQASFANPSANDMAAQYATREVVLRGPGLSDSDDIYVALNSLSSNQGDIYNIDLRYATGYDANKLTKDQPGATTQAVYGLMWNQDIKYWFIASGRRFIVIAKISTTYASLYGGFALPYGLPSEFPYPIMAGGNSGNNVRWSDQTTANSSFWNPSILGSQTTTSLLMRRTDGAIDAFANITNTSEAFAWTYPYRYLLNYRTSPDGSYALQPVVLYSSNGDGNVIGELDGVMAVSGFNNASENVITVDGDDYLVVQGGFRTTANDYAAIRLE